MKHFVGMNRAIFAAVSLLATLASCQSSKVKITGRFVGSQADMVYLEQVGTLEHSVIDSIKLSEDGGFALKIDNGTPTPTLYNVIYDNERIPLLLKAGDRVTLRGGGQRAAQLYGRRRARIGTAARVQQELHRERD